MFSPFQKHLVKAAGKYNFARTLRAIQVCQEYRSLAPKFLPPDALENTFPKSYENRTLTVGVYNSAWSQQVQMQKHHLLEALNQKFGTNAVAKIHIALSENASEKI